ncbi:MAG: phosphoglycerate kinase [Hyphomicrobium sp.]|jgi:phosphoglycerate kinase|nr:phosphoglycerate kinase [Hyphomicrobium sp.]
MNLDKLKTTDGVDVKGKRVLVRADLNVPVKDAKVTDATRLERLIPGLKDLSGRGARVIIISHFGRPKNGPEAQFSLKPVADALSGLLGGPVTFVDDCVGEAASGAIAQVTDGGIAVLENLRFHKGEEKNDGAFAAELAKLGDIFVGDAFSCAHRAHASTEGLTHHLPSYAGPLLMEEINALRTALEKPRRPVAAIVGGMKVSTKIEVLTNLVAKVDKLVIGGGMANTFLQSLGRMTGQSITEPDYHATAREIMAQAKQKNCELILPVDALVADAFAEDVDTQIVAIEKVPFDKMILDVGPKSIAHVNKVLEGCQTVLWNGPMGAFEIRKFATGTFEVAKKVAELTKAGKMVSVAGGGDTVAALNAAGVTQDFTYVSTAGGAFLEWLEGRELPGIAALTR